jgi:hypothetical protein
MEIFPPSLKIFQWNISWKNQIKQFEVLNSELTYNAPIIRSLYQANHRLAQLHPILNNSSPTNINLALTIYKSLTDITPYVCSHCVGLWSQNTHTNKLQVSKTHIKKLPSFQKQSTTLRNSTRLPRVKPSKSLHNETCIAGPANQNGCIILCVGNLADKNFQAFNEVSRMKFLGTRRS